jgi:hypothetical protein
MAENRVTTALAEVLSSGGQSQALTASVVAEVLFVHRRGRAPVVGRHTPRRHRDRDLKGKPPRGVPALTRMPAK